MRIAAAIGLLLLCPTLAAAQPMFDCAVVRNFAGKSTMSLVAMENLAKQYGVTDEKITAAKACLDSKRRSLRRATQKAGP